jgi:DNA repair protein RadD
MREDGRQVAINFLDDLDQAWVLKRNGFGFLKVHALSAPASQGGCGYVFPPPERRKHDAKASEAGILSGQVTTTKDQVQDVYYGVHTKRGASEDAPKTMRVDCRVGWHEYKSEWICFEHEGSARQKAVAWWRRHSPDPVPDTAERAVEIAEGGGIANTLGITVRTVAGDDFERITDYELGPMPEPVEVDPYFGYDPDEIPF